MSKKLLVITAGTVAAGVGQAIMAQMKTRRTSEFDVMVRCIDTAFLPNRYPNIRRSEWFQISIDPRYMHAISSNLANHSNIEKMLFPELLPSTDASGGGSIRYNGAGAVEVKREDLRKWLSTSMTDLARRGDGNKNISVALIVSAVGATGSGSLEHLIEVIVDAAHYADIRSSTQATVRCDTYILQPSQDVTDLGLANTLALYAELAASQLFLSNANSGKSYQGRKVMLGWGGDFALSSIEQLKEIAATIVRLSTDPAPTFAAEFQEREVDNHVLRELDPETHLPMHLSMVNAVTISLGRLEEQVVQRDVSRLINSLVFEQNTAQQQTDVLLSKFSDALSGESPEGRYQKLLEYLSESIGLNEKKTNIDRILTARGIPGKDKGIRLMALWQGYTEEIKQGRHRIQDFGRTFVDQVLIELERLKGDRICTGGISLTELREEYRSLENTLTSILAVARASTRTSVSDIPVTRANQALEGFWLFSWFGRDAKLRRLAGAIKRNLEERLQENSLAAALEVLEQLQRHCAEIGRNLDVILNKLRHQRTINQKLTTAANEFSLETGNPLNMVVLSTVEEMNAYADQVSIFPSDARSGSQLAEFRQWLHNRPELAILFKGSLDELVKMVTEYTKDKVHEAIEKHSVIDILQRAGEDTLQHRLAEAANKATTLVSYSKDFAPSRREAWHISAYWRNEAQREEIQKATFQAFEGQCKLLMSNDPTEVAIFYYVDGIPMSAIEDLKGRCLAAFLKRRHEWQQQKAALNGNAPTSSLNSLNQRVGVPIFSGADAERRVQATGVIARLYKARGQEVGNYSAEEIPELKETGVSQGGHQEVTNQRNGHQPTGQTGEPGNGHQSTGQTGEPGNGHQPPEQKNGTNPSVTN